MAKSKSGGTRSYIRGRVGADVYSIGKDGKGKKQQVVRSLAETVANPQTISQMRGRMIMSTVMQAVSAMSPIIDHSFDNVVAGQPSLSEFIRRNYKLVKEDVAAHGASGNKFGLVKYQEKGIKQGAYIISAGQAEGIKGIALGGAQEIFSVTLTEGATIADLLAKIGLNAEDYFTVCAISTAGAFQFVRFRVNPALAADTVISAENVATVFTTEGTLAPTFSYASNTISVKGGVFSSNNGVIVSRKADSGFIHSNCTLSAPDAPAFTADVALPTYPIGSQRFLNGGDDNALAVAATESSSENTGNNTSNTDETDNTSSGGGSNNPPTGPTGGE